MKRAECTLLPVPVGASRSITSMQPFPRPNSFDASSIAYTVGDPHRVTDVAVPGSARPVKMGCRRTIGRPMAVQTSVNRKDLFLQACRGEAVPRVPVWIMRQAGRYLPEYRDIRAKHRFLEVCKTPELAVEVSLQPFRRLGVDAVIVFSDILIPAEAMGLPLELGDAGPNLPHPVCGKSDVEKLRVFDPETETGVVPEAIRGIVKSVGTQVPVLGFAGAPWTLACYMV